MASLMPVRLGKAPLINLTWGRTTGERSRRKKEKGESVSGVGAQHFFVDGVFGLFVRGGLNPMDKFFRNP